MPGMGSAGVEEARLVEFARAGLLFVVCVGSVVISTVGGGWELPQEDFFSSMPRDD